MANQRIAPSLGLEWNEPPSKTSRGRGRRVNPQLQKIADELRSNPDKWARVAEYSSPSSASALAGRITKGVDPWGPEGDFEAVSRSGAVYAKFVADAGETTDDDGAYVISPGPVEDSGW